mmetsp:Transcript_48208/g.84803  ORF Transcript_48208/g.84803 Transcript_48208/m.84803 type:complete len:232 (+) Transcript_48208:1037-1732(+)
MSISIFANRTKLAGLLVRVCSLDIGTAGNADGRLPSVIQAIFRFCSSRSWPNNACNVLISLTRVSQTPLSFTWQHRCALASSRRSNQFCSRKSRIDSSCRPCATKHVTTPAQARLRIKRAWLTFLYLSNVRGTLHMKSWNYLTCSHWIAAHSITKSFDNHSPDFFFVPFALVVGALLKGPSWSGDNSPRIIFLVDSTILLMLLEISRCKLQLRHTFEENRIIWHLQWWIKM